MSSTAKIIGDPLPREMQQHTYSIMYQIEERHWWFVGRRRIIESFLEPVCSNLESNRSRILDIGCGTGANLEMLSRFGEAEGVDVSTEALAFCRERGLQNVRQGEAEHLPYEDGSFDVVTALDVVEHLDDDVEGLREMRRVLRTGGRRYTLEGLKRAVCEAGFEIERATYANITFFAPILLGRLVMRATGFRPASENNINVSALNKLLGYILGAESSILRHMNLPLGVSAICVARRVD